MRRPADVAMDMGLDDQRLDCERHKGDQHQRELLKRRQTHHGRPAMASPERPSAMAILGHP